MEKIIFLDIDGVILSGNDLRKHGRRYLCPDRVKMINDLCEKTGAKVVISSSWRIIENIKLFFECFDLHDDWRTDNGKGCRGDQIERWINDHRVLSYVIFDDDSDMLETQKGNFIKTELDGLQLSHVEKAIEVLTDKNRYMVCSQISNYQDKPIIHMIKFPTYFEPKWYTTVISLTYFNSGKRKGASKRDTEIYRDRCCWSPNGLYSIKTYSEWEREQEHLSNFVSNGEYILRDLDQRNYEYIHHNSLWDFYEFIGFNRKKRRYNGT